MHRKALVVTNKIMRISCQEEFCVYMYVPFFRGPTSQVAFKKNCGNNFKQKQIIPGTESFKYRAEKNRDCGHYLSKM